MKKISCSSFGLRHPVHSGPQRFKFLPFLMVQNASPGKKKTNTVRGSLTAGIPTGHGNKEKEGGLDSVLKDILGQLCLTPDLSHRPLSLIL